MFIGGAVVIPEFDETLVVVVLPTILPGKVLFNDIFDDMVVFIIGDKVIKVVFDESFLFNNPLPVELIIGNKVVAEALLMIVFVE